MPSPSDLSFFRAALERELASVGGGVLNDELAVEQESDVVVNASAFQHRELVANLCARQAEKIRLIKEALQRIEAGNFSECQRCGEQISTTRLKAVAWAPYCRECAEMIDKEKKEAA